MLISGKLQTRIMISCLTIVAVIEAGEQALKNAPTVHSVLPSFITAEKLNYVPLGLLIVAGVTWLVGHLWPKKQQAKHDAADKQQTNAPSPQSANVDEFYRTYDNIMLRESEDTIRALAASYQSGNERERFLTRLLATVVILFLFEVMWRDIFASQLKCLWRLNSVLLSLGEVRAFYDDAIATYPQMHEKRVFEVWLKWLRDGLLVLQRPDGLVEITVRGREFLKYLVHQGYDQTYKIG